MARLDHDAGRKRRAEVLEDGVWREVPFPQLKAGQTFRLRMFDGDLYEDRWTNQSVFVAAADATLHFLSSNGSREIWSVETT